MVLFGLFLAVPVYGATYYIAPDGSGTTCSSESPCKFADAIDKSNVTVIKVKTGTYTLTSVTGNWSVSESITLEADTGASPVIDGNNAYPNTHYGSLINVTAPNVTVSGLEVKNGKGRGINVSSTGDGATIRNCVVHDVWEGGIFLAGGGWPTNYLLDVIVEGCTIYRTNKNRYFYNKPLERNPPQCGAGETEGATCWNYDSAYSANLTGQYGTDFIWRNNKVYESYYEGVGAYKECSGGIIENNEIWGNSKLQVYLSSSRNITLRNNIIYGTPNWWSVMDSGASNMGGIILSGELHSESLTRDYGHKIYGNYVANTANNWVLYNIQGGTSSTDYHHTRNSFSFNNLFVEAVDKTVDYEGVGIHVAVSDAGTGNIFKNNAILQTTNTRCRDDDPARTDFLYNLWDAQPSDADCRGTGDINGTFALNGTFTTLSAGGSLSTDDFAIAGTDPGADGRGTWLTTVTSNVTTSTSIPVAETGYFRGDESIVFQGGTTATISAVSADYGTGTLTVTSPVTVSSGRGIQMAQFISGAAPDIGPWDFESDNNPPDAPSGLSVR